jgi:2-keto-4-pentenoate hydratase/2-oxohepta-3-ene-1,7-dioic acid hydratase in catechol pathway
MTLLPGDIISTGTPSGVGPLSAGDTVAVRVEGVGELANPVTGAEYVLGNGFRPPVQKADEE